MFIPLYGNFFIVLSLLKAVEFGSSILIFPRNSILQLTYGFDSLIMYNTRIVAWGLGMQTTFFFPTNLTLLHIQTYKARSEDTDISRELFYKYVIHFLESTGHSGQDCLLRAICEVAHTPFHVEKDNSILEKIAHFIFTPSLSYRDGRIADGRRRDKTIYEFEENLLFAEEMGRRQGDCKNIFSSCYVSIVDVISKVFITTKMVNASQQRKLPFAELAKIAELTDLMYDGVKIVSQVYDKIRYLRVRNLS